MKKAKTLLITLLATIMMLAMGIALAACGTKTYTVTVSETTNGTISLSPAAEGNRYEENAKVTVTVTPATGYEVENFTVSTDEDAALAEGKYTLNVTADTTISATFKATTPEPVEDKFSITKNSPENGEIEITPAADAEGKYAKNTEITVTLKPAQGYEVDTFTVGGADKKADLENNVYKFKITANTAINATFKQTSTQPPAKTTYTVTVSETTNGTISLNPTAADNKYEENAKVEVTVTPATGYEVDTFTVSTDEDAALAEGKYTLTVTADTTISATFKQTEPEKKSFTLTLPQSVENGSVEVSPASEDGKYVENTRLTVTLKPDTGYEVDAFTVDGTDKKSELHDNVYTFAITKDTTLAVSFKQTVKQFTVTVSAGQNGTVTLDPEADGNKYDENSQVTVTVTPENGYEVESFTVSTDEDAALEGSSYTLTVTDDTTITVAFKEHTHTKDTEKGLQHDATDHWYVCKDCGKEMEKASHTAAEGAGWQQDEENNKHYQLCECGARVNESEHTAKDSQWLHDDGDENTGKHYQLCVCGAKVNESTHDIDPEAYSDGTAGHHFECTVCDFKTAVAAHEQGSSEVQDNKDGLNHFYNCDVCNEKVLESHSFEWDFRGATFEYHRCSKCDYYTTFRHETQTISDKNGQHHVECTNTHSDVKCTYKSESVPCDMQWTKLENEAEGHKGNCPTCGYTVESEAHDKLGLGGACSKCGYLGEHTHKDEQAKLMKDGKELTLTDYRDGLCDECGQQLESPVWEANTSGKLTLKESYQTDVNYKKIVIPAEIPGVNYTKVAMNKNTNITDVIVPGTIFVDNQAFSGCTALEHAVILSKGDSTGKLPSNLFKDCSALKWVVVSAEVTSINDTAFGGSIADGCTIYFMGTSTAWSMLVSALSTSKASYVFLTKEETTVRYLNDDTEAQAWYWSEDEVIPHDGKKSN